MMHLELGLGLFAAMMVLVALRMPVALAMFATGAIGFAQLTSWNALLNHMNDAAVSRVSSYDLSVVPLFILMGQFATHGGLGRSVFHAARAWFGHYRGGLAIATIGGCAGFGAICGSSIATGATMTAVALPEMRRYGYSGALSTGSLAAGGTLGILIPPSVILVIYALITEQSIGDLFLAAIIPGVIATVGYIIAVMAYVRLVPGAAPAADRLPMAERLKSLNTVWPVVVIFLTVIGGIYTGVFTPTEAAGIGAAATGLFALVSGNLGKSALKSSLLDMARTTGMIFVILIGAELYSAFLALSQIPQSVAAAIVDSGLAPMAVLLVIVAIYIVLGCVMDGIGMIMLTIPVFQPIIAGLDFGMTPEATGIWFGILVLVVVEVGLITPPIGLNVYVINGMARDVRLSESFRGIVPFFISDLCRIAIIILIPATCTLLPRLE
ncbi:MAG: C4-dicarboxylate ABC transporter permease [Betaproteobacteria bacterium RIFCSPLOWO2_02_FULL_63_19]|nr:MAG: C4-dicarboxylate ABC transporter permease [Betaproteobacteria bacterium RIFCSPLOWO2_02_FULL_63_19]